MYDLLQIILMIINTTGRIYEYKFYKNGIDRPITIS